MKSIEGRIERLEQAEERQGGFNLAEELKAARLRYQEGRVRGERVEPRPLSEQEASTPWGQEILAARRRVKEARERGFCHVA